MSKTNKGKKGSQNKKIQREKLPTNIAESIPYKYVYENGIIEIKTGYFSKSYPIPDASFITTNKEGQEKLAISYSEFLTAFEDDAQIEITLYKRNIEKNEYENVFMQPKGDKNDKFRTEFNSVLSEKMTKANNNLTVEKFLTVTVEATDIFDATNKFEQIDTLVSDNMNTMTRTYVKPLTTIERLDLLNNIYKQEEAISLTTEENVEGHKSQFFSLLNCAKQGISTKDVIGPSSMTFPSSVKIPAAIGKKLIKVFYISNFPTWIRGTILTDFVDVSTNMLVSVYFNPIAQDEGIKMVRKQGVNVSSKLVDMQKKSARKGIDADLLGASVQDAKDEIKELIDSMTKDNVKLFTSLFLITIFADDEEELEGYETQLKMIANKHMVQISSLDYQQENGFASSLPLGNNKLLINRLMPSTGIASIIPFSVKDMMQKKGIWYGLNAVSKNIIVHDRAEENINPNACILGIPGSGKSFITKEEIEQVLLNTDDEIYVIDPEREYVPIAVANGGSVVKFGSASKTHINPFDLNITINEDDDIDPVKNKADFIHTICSIMIGGNRYLTDIELSIIDRCASEIYDDYLQYLHKTGKTQDKDHAPTMQDFYNSILRQDGLEAQNLALSLERFVKGSADMFSHRTNVDITNRFTVYDIKDVVKGMKDLTSQICFDNIWNKMMDNWANGKRTWIYIDEFHNMMKYPSSAQYIVEIWKRARKWAGIPCAITQNVEDMLKSSDARTVINNSAMIILLEQSSINKIQLSEMLSISKEEEKYISSSKIGSGLIRIGENCIIPLDASFPRNTELYKIMSSKADERL